MSHRLCKSRNIYLKLDRHSAITSSSFLPRPSSPNPYLEMIFVGEDLSNADFQIQSINFLNGEACVIFDILIMCIHVLFRYMGKRINLHSVNQISLHCLRRMDGCHSLSPFLCFSLSALFLSFQGMRISRKMSLMWVTMSDRSSCTS